MYKILLILTLTLLCGCTGYQRNLNQLATSLNTTPPEIILAKLQEAQPRKRDYAQFHLNKGYLEFINGDFASAITTLTLAKKEMSVLQATSVSENLGAGTISETLRSYSGYPTDRVMVHNILALSYLFSNNINSARVEILQADIAMKKLADKDSLNGQLASTHLISGIVYEMLNEQSNALISYRFAADTIKQRGQPVPQGLKQALLRMSFKLGTEQQFFDYQKQFPDLSVENLHRKNQVFVLYFDGVVSHKVENTVVLPNRGFDQLIRISMPAYPQPKQNIKRIQLSVPEQQLVTEAVENVEVLAREDLDKEYPSILLLTTTRALAKYELVYQANKQDSVVGLLLNIATLISEEADLRSWNMLPASIQFAYLETNQNELKINESNGRSESIDINNSSQNIILINSLSDQVFQYQRP
ncbi:COG3014 family protein [Psychromonas sp.]|uniref:COG3014 family protein n=1 Tax=Psychromonas sp. TaxID=1884585 RepID=UPI0035629A52